MARTNVTDETGEHRHGVAASWLPFRLTYLGENARPGDVYGKLTNRSLKSVAFAASPSIGVTPKISSIVRSVELWV